MGQTLVRLSQKLSALFVCQCRLMATLMAKGYIYKKCLRFFSEFLVGAEYFSETV